MLSAPIDHELNNNNNIQMRKTWRCSNRCEDSCDFSKKFGISPKTRPNHNDEWQRTKKDRCQFVCSTSLLSSSSSSSSSSSPLRFVIIIHKHHRPARQSCWRNAIREKIEMFIFTTFCLLLFLIWVFSALTKKSHDFVWIFNVKFSIFIFGNRGWLSATVANVGVVLVIWALCNGSDVQIGGTGAKQCSRMDYYCQSLIASHQSSQLSFEIKQIDGLIVSSTSFQSNRHSTAAIVNGRSPDTHDRSLWEQHIIIMISNNNKRIDAICFGLKQFR